MSEFRDITILRHYQSIVSKYNRLQMKRPLKSDEVTQRNYAQFKIDEEYNKPIQDKNAVESLAYEHVALGGYESWKDELRQCYIAGWNACIKFKFQEETSKTTKP